MDETKASYEIIKQKLGTLEGCDVVYVVRGEGRAVQMVEHYKRKLTTKEHDEGWSYYCERTDLKPGTDPKFATELWWQRQEARQAKGQRPTMRDRRLNQLWSSKKRSASNKANDLS